MTPAAPAAGEGNDDGVNGTRAVFLDRDGTVIRDVGYLGRPEQVELLPGAAGGLARLAEAGFLLIVVTNQSGVGRGMFGEQAVRETNAEVRRQLSAAGVELHGVYYCPYHPEAVLAEYRRQSDLRKPQPGMLLKAAAEMNIDLARSWMVGDSPCDVSAGRRAGCRTILIAAPKPPGVPAELPDAEPDFEARDLAAAAQLICREDRPVG